MSGGGGSTTTVQQAAELPSWLQDAAQSNLARADYVAQLGYVPQYGLDVAGFTPMQTSAMQNTANAASAFGLSAPTNAMAGMPAQQTNNLGFSGYSSGQLFDDALLNLQANRPAQYNAINDQFINPITGESNVAFTPVGSMASPDASHAASTMATYGGGEFDAPVGSNTYYMNGSPATQWLAENFGNPNAIQFATSPFLSILGKSAKDYVDSTKVAPDVTTPVTWNPSNTGGGESHWDNQGVNSWNSNLDSFSIGDYSNYA